MAFLKIPAQDLLVDIKRTKRYDAGQQHFPGSVPELPLLLHANTQGVENKEQEEYAVYRTDELHPAGIAANVFNRNCQPDKHDQGNAFEEAHQAQAPDF